MGFFSLGRPTGIERFHINPMIKRIYFKKPKKYQQKYQHFLLVPSGGSHEPMKSLDISAGAAHL